MLLGVLRTNAKDYAGMKPKLTFPSVIGAYEELFQFHERAEFLYNNTCWGIIFMSTQKAKQEA